jgi:hypothetical protein
MTLKLEDVLSNYNDYTGGLYWELEEEDGLMGIENLISFHMYKNVVENINCYGFSSGHRFKKRLIKYKEEVLDYLKIPRYINPNSDVCCVCLEGIISKSNAYITNCGHKFHKTCLYDCSNHDDEMNCPYCRCEGAISNSIGSIIEDFEYPQSFMGSDVIGVSRTVSLLNDWDPSIGHLLIDSVCNRCFQRNRIKYRHKCMKCHEFVYGKKIHKNIKK